MDFTGGFALLSIYNANEKIYTLYKKGSHVWIMNPFLKKIEVLAGYGIADVRIFRE
jgi:hypothetical protein